MQKELKEKNIVVYINRVSSVDLAALKEWGKEEGKSVRVLCLYDTSTMVVHDSMQTADLVLGCDFTKPGKIASTLLPYQEELLAITCVGDANVMKLAQVIPHVPYLRTPSVESLEWTSDKLKMRRRLKLYDPKNTPRFAHVRNNTKKERERVIGRVQFPMIIKPTNLSASLLVSICYHEEELEQTLRTTFRKLAATYKKDKRIEEPQVIAEEFMDGEMYSLDAYVNSRGKIEFCPLVRVMTGRSVGHADFYNYLRITPTDLKKSTVANAEHRVEVAVHALGLRNTTVHAELMKLDDEWRIIEVGARMGAFRHKLHMLSCDINHSLNDVLTRVPRRVRVPKKCKGYSATFRYYPEKEGVITEMKGIKKAQELKSFVDMSVKMKIGERAVFSSNGGKEVFSFHLYNESRSILLADIRRVQQQVKVRVASRMNNGVKKEIEKPKVKKKISIAKDKKK